MLRHSFDYKSPNYVEELVNYLSTAVRNGNFDVLSIFLAVLPIVANTWKVLDMIMER